MTVAMNDPIVRDRTLLKTLVALAWADDQLSPEEDDWLGWLLQDSGLSAEEALSILRNPKAGPTQEELCQALPDPEDRILFLRTLMLVSLSDGTTSPSELAYMQTVSNWLGVDPDRLEQMRRTEILVVDP